MAKRKRLYKSIIDILIITLLLAIIGSVALARHPIGLKELVGFLGMKFIEITPYWSKPQESLLLLYRLPQIILVCLVGCCLVTAGAAYQIFSESHDDSGVVHQYGRYFAGPPSDVQLFHAGYGPDRNYLPSWPFFGAGKGPDCFTVVHPTHDPNQAYLMKCSPYMRTTLITSWWPLRSI